jgi:S-adenosylmethionine:tRNA ribosyltransferase-isomerase
MKLSQFNYINLYFDGTSDDLLHYADIFGDESSIHDSLTALALKVKQLQMPFSDLKRLVKNLEETSDEQVINGIVEELNDGEDKLSVCKASDEVSSLKTKVAESLDAIAKYRETSQKKLPGDIAKLETLLETASKDIEAIISDGDDFPPQDRYVRKEDIQKDTKADRAERISKNEDKADKDLEKLSFDIKDIDPLCDLLRETSDTLKNLKDYTGKNEKPVPVDSDADSDEDTEDSSDDSTDDSAQSHNNPKQLSDNLRQISDRIKAFCGTLADAGKIVDSVKKLPKKTLDEHKNDVRMLKSILYGFSSFMIGHYIAQTPTDYVYDPKAKTSYRCGRDECRLMVLNRKTGKIEHRRFKDIINYCDEGDTFVFNDTKVFPARLHGHKGPIPKDSKKPMPAKIEVFLLRELSKDPHLWDVLVDPARKIRIGNKLSFDENDMLKAEVIDNTTSRGRTLRFLYDGPYDEFKSLLFKLGEMPLPKFVRPYVVPEDSEDYQNIYASKEGAVACPAAGLHFSRELFKRMEIKGVNASFLTLHMGLGHFKNVDVEDLSKHKMDSEEMFISEDTANEVNGTKHTGHKVFAVGITVVRALETYVTTQDEIRPYHNWTNKFIFPPYEFHIPNAIVTNFHLPSSTMLMTAAAFAGYDHIIKAYKEAIRLGYKFGPYGDAMLII